MRSIRVFLALSIAFLLSNTASAQNCALEDTLLACSHISLEGCRDDVGCATDRSEALSVQDIVESVAASCCSFATKKANKCIKKYTNRLSRTIALAPANLKPFLREVKAEVTELRTNGCSTGSLGNL
jgi:hypothetical protein